MLKAGLLLFFIMSSAFASGEKPLCEMQLLSKDFLRDWNSFRVGPSVQYAGELDGSHNGSLAILEVPNAIGGSWNSRYQSISRATQGDPRQIVSILGPRLTYFIGVRKITELKITIPDADEVRGAIKKLNVALKKLGYVPIAVQFYKQPDVLPGAYQFLKAFIYKMRLPFATSEEIRIHDTSFHLYSIVLPADILQPILENYKMTMEFYDYAMSQKPNAQVQATLNQMLEFLEASIDLGLGNIQSKFTTRVREVPLLRPRKQPLAEVRNKAFYDALNETWNVFSLGGGPTSEFIQKALGTNKALTDLLGKFLAQEKYRKVINKRPPSLTGEELYKRIVTRHAELIRALFLLRQGKKHEFI